MLIASSGSIAIRGCWKDFRINCAPMGSCSRHHRIGDRPNLARIIADYEMTRERALKWELDVTGATMMV